MRASSRTATGRSRSRRRVSRCIAPWSFSRAVVSGPHFGEARSSAIVRRVTLDLARRLLASGAVTARDVEAALYLSVVRGVSLPRALVDRGVLGERALEDELSRKAGLPIRQVA